MQPTHLATTIYNEVGGPIAQLTTIAEEKSRFDPERFSAERSVGRPKCSYVPFGAGQRTCLGNLLALLKGPLILAMVTQRYRVTPVSREEPGFDVGVTLSPRGGLPVRLTLR